MRNAPRDDYVFINFPFDPPYRPLFDAAVFAVHDAGFIARCAMETIDTGETRLAKIIAIIGECPYGPHDISRTEPNALGLPRFNMPFELGLYLGCKAFGGSVHRRKRCLVMDREPYRYQAFLSDIAGQDIHPHGDDPLEVIRGVRDWLRVCSGRREIPGAGEIVRRFSRFRTDLPAAYHRCAWLPRT